VIDRLRAATERRTWSPPRFVRSELLLGVFLFLLIVAMIVFAPSESYRFYYGPQF